MTVKYQVEIEPGFTGSHEGHEFVHKAARYIGKKAVIRLDRHDWIEKATYTFGTEGEVKHAIQGILKAGKGFLEDPKGDLLISIDDETKKLYPSGEFNSTKDDIENDKGFVLVTISELTKPSGSEPAPVKKKSQGVGVFPSAYKEIMGSGSSSKISSSATSSKPYQSSSDVYDTISSGLYWKKKK
jgi:hypothetical protein